MRVVFYVPDKGNNGESGSKVLEEVCERVCLLFGGCTVYTGFGRWHADDGRLASEPVHIVEAYGEKSEHLDDIASYIRKSLSQECVTYSLDNELVYY